MIYFFTLLIYKVMTFGVGPVIAPANVGIEINQNYTAVQLVDDIFVKAGCNNVSNIETFGNDLSVGYFQGGAEIINLSDGIIISSGDVFLAAGPNESVRTEARFGDLSNDPDLRLSATNVLFDVAGISFDFIPLEETVTFRYVFASEEYCEFVGSVFNDVFGFFVSGPGIDGDFADGAINVALIPETGETVAINSVNHADNSGYYVKNELEEDALQCGILYDPRDFNAIEFDGFTIPLRATFDVIPCETYHIRLVVGDVGDDKLDSAVFLESQSFDLGRPVSVRAEVDGYDEPIAVEGCRDGRFVFNRLGQDINQPTVVNYAIGQGSEAENGVDFAPISGSITIPAGQATVALPIEIVEDQLPEDVESLYLELEYECDCILRDTAILFLTDQTEVSANFDPITLCANQETTITPNVTGGAPPYTYTWDTGVNTPFLNLATQVPITHTVAITDFCGSTTTATAEIDLQTAPEAALSGSTTICPGSVGYLDVIMGGTAPWSLAYQRSGDPPVTISNITENPYPIAVDTSGTYQLISFADAYCEGTASGMGQVNVPTLDLSVQLDAPSCPNAADGRIRIVDVTASEPYQIIWEVASADPLELNQLQAGTYRVTLTDATGCQLVQTYELVPEPITQACLEVTLFVPNAFSPNADGFNDYFQLFPSPTSSISSVQSLQIFNRWGAVVFEKNNFPPNASEPLWDGHFKGRSLESGIFVWQAIVLLEDGSTAVYSGDILLIK